MERHGSESYFVLGEGLLAESGGGRERSLAATVEEEAPPFRFSRMGPRGAGRQLSESSRKKLGNTMAGLAGIFVVLMSPIFFPVSRLPEWMQPVAQVSPFTHAANALDAILSGESGYLGEFAILAAIAAVTLSIGLAGMRWREN
jgi:hypothetical protein